MEATNLLQVPIVPNKTASVGNDASACSTNNLVVPNLSLVIADKKQSETQVEHSTALIIRKFLNEVSGPATCSQVDASLRNSLLESSNKMAFEPGSPRPQNFLSFSIAAENFIAAAKANKVGQLDNLDRQMIFISDIPWETREKVYVDALIASAEGDAFGSTEHILKKKKNSYVTESKKWQVAIEAAFITACKLGSYDVVGLYLSDALGEEYSTSVKLRPEIMAWGIYRSTEGQPSHELLTKVEEVNPNVAGIYRDQTIFIAHAEAGRDFLVQEAIESGVWNELPFVIREAAEKTINAEQKDTLSILLPAIPLYWLPELVYFSGRQGRVDMVDDVIARAQTLRKMLHQPFLGESRADITPYYDENLLAQGIRGAASTGKIEALTRLAERGQQTGRCAIAAKAAIENNQPAVLSWAISDIKQSEPDYLQQKSKELLRELMTQALKQQKWEARDLLLREKGGILSVTDKHILMAIAGNDKNSYNAFIDGGTARRDFSYALRQLCRELKEKLKNGKSDQASQSLDLSDYILDLFERTTPSDKVAPANLRSEQLIAEDRVEATAELGSSNQHKIIATLLSSGQLTEKAIERGYYGTVGYCHKESYNLLSPLVSHEAVKRAFDAISGRDGNWQPSKGSRQFLPGMIDTGAIEADKLVRGAIYLSNSEVTDKGAEDSPAALSILKHAKFPTDRLNEVLIQIGMQSNFPCINWLMAQPEVNTSIGHLYQAAKDQNIVQIALHISEIKPGQEEVLKNAATHCIYKNFNEGAIKIIEEAADKLDLSDLALTAQLSSNHAVLIVAVTKGFQVEEHHISALVDKNDKEQLAILEKGKNVSPAAAEYLRKLEEKTWLNPEWKTARTDLIASLRALSGYEG